MNVWPDSPDFEAERTYRIRRTKLERRGMTNREAWLNGFGYGALVTFTFMVLAYVWIT